MPTGLACSGNVFASKASTAGGSKIAAAAGRFIAAFAVVFSGSLVADAMSRDAICVATSKTGGSGSAMRLPSSTPQALQTPDGAHMP